MNTLLSDNNDGRLTAYRATQLEHNLELTIYSRTTKCASDTSQFDYVRNPVCAKTDTCALIEI